MSNIYNILNEEEMNETISVPECRNLRQMMTTLTMAPVLTKREYVRFCTLINQVCDRLEKEGSEDLVENTVK